MDGNEKLYDLKARSDESGLVCNDPSLTVQSDAADADINVMMARMHVTGGMPEGVRVPEYGDYTHIVDYRTALEAVQEAEANFMAMPADVRSVFQNDPQAFLEYALDPSNIDGLRELGLAVPLPKAPTEPKGDPETT